jgi:hypothetical protein
VSNANLVALYGLAKDLSERAAGEWSHLKRYRNLFEHELCLIRSEATSADLPVWLRDNPIETIHPEPMRADALDMLRFTRAAMFHFAFLIRGESRDKSGGRAEIVVFSKKPIGKI